MVDITKLPKAKSGFEELRSQNQIYVDHTDLIYEFAYLDGPNFLSRPRRFGKSLLTLSSKNSPASIGGGMNCFTIVTANKIDF
ncbi:MAG: AAA family ATPase [Succinivibrio sp.]|nr:AAA family ATPase [Succinivibrio sp.]